MANDIPEQLCAEFALGILEGAERERALQLIENNPDFAAEVEKWQNYLSPLSEVLPSTDAPETIISKLEQVLNQREQANLSFDNGISEQVQALKNKLAAWRIAAVSLGIAATVMGFVVMYVVNLYGEFSNSKTNQYVAVLRDNNGQDGFVVTLSSTQKYVVVRSLGMWPPKSKSYELWLLKKEQETPETLGLVATSPYVKLKIPKVLHREDRLGGLKLAVSLEPEGGAPKGKSMGKILFAGKLVQQMP